MLLKNCILLWKWILNQNLKWLFVCNKCVMMFFRSTEHMLILRPKAWGLHWPAKAACKSKQRKERERKPQDTDILAGEESLFIYLHLKGHCVLCSVWRTREMEKQTWCDHSKSKNNTAGTPTKSGGGGLNKKRKTQLLFDFKTDLFIWGKTRTDSKEEAERGGNNDCWVSLTLRSSEIVCPKWLHRLCIFDDTW